VPFKVEKAMKIAQMVIKPVFKVKLVEVKELSESERAEGGFGSTGTK
jgi:dUTP pyrophosphatase